MSVKVDWTLAIIESVCCLKRCIDGLVKIELETASSKTFSACARMRISDAGDLKVEARRSQLKGDLLANGLPPKLLRLCRSQTCRSWSHVKPSPLDAFPLPPLPPPLPPWSRSWACCSRPTCRRL